MAVLSPALSLPVVGVVWVTVPSLLEWLHARGAGPEWTGCATKVPFSLAEDRLDWNGVGPALGGKKLAEDKWSRVGPSCADRPAHKPPAGHLGK